MNFLNDIFWGNTVGDYLWSIGAILFILILNRLISKFLVFIAGKIFKQKWNAADYKNFTNLIVHPLGVFLVISVSIIAFYRLHYPPEFKSVIIYKYSLQKIILSIAIIIQIIACTWLFMRIIDFIAGVLHKKTALHPQSEIQLIVFFRDFIKVVIGVFGLMVLLHQAFGYDVSSLVTGLSIVGAAIALALRESLENLIASFVIFFDKPFTTGDFVKVQNIAGNIERIGLRSTRVRTGDKTYVTVPNKQMVDSMLENISLRSQIRGEIDLYLNLQTPPGKIEELQNEIKRFIATTPEIQSSTVLLNDIRIQSFFLFIEFFTPPMDWSQFTGIKEKLNYFILQTMERLDIKIAAAGKDVIVSKS